jgi:atypical dual specificity phosphatase
LIDEFKKTKVELKRKITALKAEGRWEGNPVEKMKYLPKGHLFRAQMPVGIARNPEKGISELKTAGITRLFLLCSAKECEATVGTDLIKLYSDHGIKVVHFPIKDFGAWDQEEFNQKVHQLHCHLLQGDNVAVHCKAGIGRTGTMIAALVGKVLKIDGAKAIEYTRKHSHPASVETMDQRELVITFAKKYFRHPSK